MPVDAQKVVKKCLRKNLSPNLAAFGVGKETWEERRRCGTKREGNRGDDFEDGSEKRELMWHLEEIAGNDTHEAYLEREMWDRLAKSRKNQSVAAEEAFTVEETAVALLTLHEAQIKRSNIIAALNRIVPLGSKVLNEDAVRADYPKFDVPGIKAVDVLAKRLSVQDWAAQKLVSQYGVDFTEELLKHLNRKGPISLRVNLVANDGDEFKRGGEHRRAR